MAFLLNNTSIASHLRSASQKPDGGFAQSRRAFHVELGTREKELLAENDALRGFKSHKKGVRQLKRVGDVLTLVLLTGCCYEIYARATMQKED